MLESSPKNPFVEKISSEISGLIEEAEVELKKQLEAVFPEVCEAVNQRRAEFYVISQQMKFVQEKQKQGIAEDSHVNMVLEELQGKYASLKLVPPKVSKINLAMKIQTSILSQIFESFLLEQFVANQNYQELIL